MSVRACVCVCVYVCVCDAKKRAERERERERETRQTYQQCIFPCVKISFQPNHSKKIKVVRRLIEKKKSRLAEKSSEE